MEFDDHDLSSGHHRRRFLAFDSTERFLYVANSGGDSIVACKVVRQGLLAPNRLRTKIGSPACIFFSR